jgi:hypothetical protein
MKVAVPMARDHRASHEALEKALPSADVKSWTLAIEAWERDKTKVNPFEVKVVRECMAVVLLSQAVIDV